jgi:hypothetical protein
MCVLPNPIFAYLCALEVDLCSGLDADFLGDLCLGGFGQWEALAGDVRAGNVGQGDCFPFLSWICVCVCVCV